MTDLMTHEPVSLKQRQLWLYTSVAMAMICVGCWWYPEAIPTLLLLGTGIFMFWRRDLTSTKWRGLKCFGNRPRPYTAAITADGRVSVVLQNQGRTQICVADINGSLHPVTSGPFNADPAWDPSGNHIAYISLDYQGRSALRILDLKDQSDILILKDKLISQPKWTNDGQSILFLKSREDKLGESTVCAVDLATQVTTPIAEITYNRPQAWDLLTDSRRIAYVADGAIWVKSILEGSAERLAIDAQNPCMVAGSPDGSLLFVCDAISSLAKSAMVMDIHTGKVTKILTGYVRYALWSPSNQWLAIPCYDDTHVFRIHDGSASATKAQNGTVVAGVGVSWHGECGLVLIRPSLAQNWELVEIDLRTGSMIAQYC